MMACPSSIALRQALCPCVLWHVLWPLVCPMGDGPACEPTNGPNRIHKASKRIRSMENCFPGEAVGANGAHASNACEHIRFTQGSLEAYCESSRSSMIGYCIGFIGYCMLVGGSCIAFPGCGTGFRCILRLFTAVPVSVQCLL